MAVEKLQRKTDRKWRADEETGGSYTRTQNWEDTSTSDLPLLIKFRKLSTFKML